jgi:hypothetical protein
MLQLNIGGSQMGKIRKRDKNKIVKKTNVYILVIIVITLILSAGIRYYFKYAPQVSKKDTEALLTKYHQDLVQLYGELIDSYTILKDEGNADRWESFSAEWVPRVITSKPDELNKRLYRDYYGRLNQLTEASRNILLLWQEYQAEFEGKGLSLEKTEGLKEKIGRLLKDF